MSKFKLKAGAKIGALAAEADQLLTDAFIDTGYLEILADTADPRFILLGRTGSGKTALIERLKSRKEGRCSKLDPELLSLQYLQNSQILKVISGWGVNLEVFYKFLWRHVSILELIRIRYATEDDIPSALGKLFDLSQLTKKGRKAKETKETAEQYLKTYAGDYWVTTDTRIKHITEELETKLEQHLGIDFKAEKSPIRAGFKASESSATGAREKTESDVVQRTQAIVSDFLIADLNKVVELMAKHGFQDDQKPYYIVIDDLDKNWMPDDKMYLDLLKSLIFAISDLNRTIKNVKILVVLRENLYFRIFSKADKHDPQREKIDDLNMHIKWKYHDLVSLLENRLNALFRKQYTKEGPKLWEILPSSKKKGRGDPVDFILERSLMRPRDIIEFMNIYLDKSNLLTETTWANLSASEIEYSKRRLTAVHDEWKDSYFSLPCLFDLLGKLKPRFSWPDITKEMVEAVLENKLAEDCSWLSKHQNDYIGSQVEVELEALKKEFIKVLYRVGLVGAVSANNEVTYVFDQPFAEVFAGTFREVKSIEIHRAFRTALGIVDA